jgi:hypothetical protein
VTTVRPSTAALPTPIQTPPAGAGRAAARAFFQAALDKTLPPQAAQASAAPVQVQSRPAAPAPAETTASDQPKRLPRPGSLLDIRV